MYFTGFADEAAPDLEGQIAATLDLGWRNIEARAIDGTNLTMIGDREFDAVCEKLGEAGISVNCFGSGVGNWARKITESPEPSYEEMRRAIPRMHRLGTKMIRIMSFVVPPEVADRDWSAETISRLRVIARIAEEGGVTCVHENCSGWGGDSPENSLRLVEEIDSPALRLVFDTGNPIFHGQDPLEFYRAVRDFVIYIHIKDGEVSPEGKNVCTFPGEGRGRVREILEDLFRRGYDGGISIEPHMAVLAHDKSVKADARVRYDNYVEYGRRLEKLVAGIKAGLS